MPYGTLDLLDGVDGAAISFGVPPASGSLYFYDVVPDVPRATPVKVVIHTYGVTPAFLPVYGIRLREGRVFQPGDAPDSVVISESLAASLWPEQSAVGRTMQFDGRTFRVVGVTEELRTPLLDPRSDEPEMYELLLSDASTATQPALAPTSITLTTRCTLRCPPLEAIRAHLTAAAPGVEVAVGRLVRDAHAQGLERPRTGAILAVAFAIIACWPWARGSSSY